MADQDLGTTIKFTVDSTGVEAGATRVKRSIKEIGQTASDTGKQTGSAIGGGGDEAAKKMEAATRRISNEFKRLQVDAESAGKTLSEKLVIKADAYGIPRAAIADQLASLKAFEAAQRATNPAMIQFQKLADQSGQSVAGLNAALRQVPAQFTDIVTSLQGGQKPLTVLLQQGGQLKDAFGGIAPAARALGGYVAGLVNPLSLAAAAVGTLGYAYYAGSKEQDEYRKSLILTGNTIGLTGGQMQDMARSMAAIGGTQSKAAEALVEFVNAGAAGAGSLQKFTASAIAFEKATGTAVSETAKQFAALGEKPLEASIELNKATGFLTMALYEQVKALEEQGKHTEAAKVAQNAYSDTLDQNTAIILANLGTIERGWMAIASAGKAAIDSIKNVGRPDTPKQKIDALNVKIDDAQGLVDLGKSSGAYGPEWIAGKEKVLQSLKDQRDALQKTAALEAIRATESGITAKNLEAQIKFDQSHEKYMTNAVKLKRELARAEQEYKDASPDEDSRKKNLPAYLDEVAKLKDQYKEKAAPKPKAEKVERFGNELTAAKQWLSTQESMIRDSYNAQQNAIEDAYKAQEITAAQYYARQLASDEASLREREQVRAEAQKRFDAEMAERVATTEARPASKARTTALENLKNEAEQFALAQKAAQQKDLNAIAANGDAMAREINKQSQKVTESVDTYIADMQRKAQADATLLAAREAMAGQAPEIIAGMEAELKVRADAAGLLDKTAEAYALAAKNAREYEGELQAQYDSGKEVTTAQIRMLEEWKAAAVDAKLALVKLGGSVDTSAIDAGSRAMAASIKAQTDAVTKEIQKSLVDGIMSAGKDGGAGLRKALEDALITRPFRMAIEAYFLPISNAIYQGAAGQTLGASAAGATGLQSTLNAASLAVSSFGSTLIGTAANVATGGATLAQTWAAGSAMMNTAGGTMAGIAMKIGAAAPYIAAAAGAANVLSNALERANGSVTAAGIFAYGRNSSDGFKTGGRADFIQDGGGGTNLNSSWFDPGEVTSKYMSAMGELVTKSVKGWAEAIGLSAEAVNGYTETVQAAIGNGMSKAEERQSIDKAMAGYGDAMVQALFGQIMALAKPGEAASATLERLGNDLTAVNSILSGFGKPLFDASFNSAKSVQELLNSVGGLDKLKGLSADLVTVNDNLAQLGLPLFDVSVASAKAAQGMLTATESAVKALDAAEKLEASYASFAKNLSKDPETTQVASLQGIFSRAMSLVTAAIPSIKGVSGLTGVTVDQYASFSEPQRTKLDAAAKAYKDLQTAIDSAAKSAESAAKSAKDAADTAAKAYSDALQSVQEDTQSILAQTSDIGKTEFQKQLAQIQRDGAKKQAELDKLSTASDKAAKEYADLTKAATDSAKAVTTLATVFDDASAGAKALGGTASKMIADIATALAKAGVKTPEAQRAEALAMTVVQPGKGFATGGAIAGPGTGTSDSIPAMLSDGEYVIKASSAAKLGTRFLDAINAGGMPATVFRADGGSVGFDPNSKKSIIDTWVGALNWSAETMLSSALTLKNVAEDNGITVAQLKEFGYSLDNFSTDTQALIKANVSPKTWDWANGAVSATGGQPFTPTSSTGKTSTPGATSGSSVVEENTAAKLAAAYETQRVSMLGLYKATETQTDANNALAAAGYDVSGLSADGIKKYFAGLLDAAKPIYNEDGTIKEFSADAIKAINQIDKLGGSIGTLTKVAEDRQNWQDKLDVLTGKTTEQALSRQKELAGTTDTATISIIKQVHAQEDLAKATAALKTYTDAYASLNVELLSAMGDKSQAYAVQKAIDLADVYRDQTPATAALISKQYDLNAARKEEIELLNSAKTRLENYTNAGASKGVELLRLQGDTAGADKAQEAIDLADVFKSTAEATALLATEGLTPLDKAAIQATIQTNDLTIAQYARNKALDQEIETLRRYKAMSDTATSALDNTANSVTNSRIGLLNAQGNTAGAAALQRELDITPYTKAIKDAQTELEKATTATEKSTLADVVAKNTQAIANYDLSKSLDKEAEAARAAQEAANALAQAYAGLKDQIAQARIELLKASGQTQAAEEATMALALRDHAGDEYYASLYRELLTIQKLTEARQQLNTLEDSAVQKQIALKRAQGDGILANAIERSAALKTALAPASAAKAELDRSNVSWTDFLATKGAGLTPQWAATGNSLAANLASGQSSASSFESLTALQNSGYGPNFLPEDLRKLLYEFGRNQRTPDQKASLQGVVDTTAGIVAAYDRNKALESELKIIELQDEAYKNNLDAQKAVTEAQRAYADVLKSTISTLQDFLKTLDGAASPLQNLSGARANFRAVADKAATGDTSAYKDLTPAAKTFLDLSKSYSRSIQDYQRDEARVRATLNAVIKVNQSELDKLPKEIAAAADPTKDAWVKLQEAILKETNTSVMLTALSVNAKASKRRLRAAEESLSDRYVEVVYMLDEAKKTPLLKTFNDAIKKLVDTSVLPEYTAFNLGDIWGTKIASVLPKTPLTNAELNKIISSKFPGLLKSDFHVPLTPDQLTQLLNGKFPTLTSENLVGVPADMVKLVNEKLAGVLPPGFAGERFDARAMMQAAIDNAISGGTSSTGTNFSALSATQAAAMLGADTATVTDAAKFTTMVNKYKNNPGLVSTLQAAGVDMKKWLNDANAYGAAKGFPGFTNTQTSGSSAASTTQTSGSSVTGNVTGLSPKEIVAKYSAGASVTDWFVNSSLSYISSLFGNVSADVLNDATRFTAMVKGFGDNPERIDFMKSQGVDMAYWFGNAGIWGKHKGFPGFAQGTNYVPHDMLAQIHKGEAIIPAPFNPERYGRASGNESLVEEIKALRAEVARLREEQKAGQNAIAANTRKTAQALTKFDTDGMPETRS